MMNAHKTFREIRKAWSRPTREEKKIYRKMENRIGRRLEKNEVVHHVDHNKLNNDISNLQLMTRSEHASLHGNENHKNRERNDYGQFM